MKKYKNAYTVCIAVTLMFFALFTARLINWQLIGGDDYRELASLSGAAEEKSEPARGQIYDKNGKGLIVNQTRYRVVVQNNSADSSGLDKTISALTELMKKTGNSYNKNIPESTAVGEPFVFADNLKKESVGAVAEHIQNLSGVSIEQYLVRGAEDPTLAPHILGALGAVTEEDCDSGEYGMNDKIGKFGIEASFEKELRGKSGEKLLFRDPDGEMTEEIKRPAKRGNNIWLTLDKKLQKTASVSLEKNVKAARAEGEAQSKLNAESNVGEDCSAGAVVMLDVRDFSVLAAASCPTYDLNKYSLYGDYYIKLSQDESLPMFDRAFDGVFACGSVFKPCVALAALEEKVIEKETEFYCTKYYDYYPSSVVECMHYHGAQNVESAMIHSCNWFFAETGRRLGIKRIDSYAERLGLGGKTGVEFGEAEGMLAGRDSGEWQAGNTPQAAIGQSDNAFTPVQLATYTATLANNGTRLKTHLVSKITSYDNSEVISDFSKPQIARKSTFSEKNLKIVQNAMRGVARDYEGTAYSVFGDYKVDIAAKTGTAENAGSDHAVFICYAPFEKPEVAIAVVIENGVKGKYAMQVANDLLDEYFEREQKPSN